MPFDVSLIVKENNQRKFVEAFVQRITKDSFVMCARVESNDDYDEFTNVHSGSMELESAINRNSIKLPYRTNGTKIETLLNKASIDVFDSNFFSVVVAYLLTNHYDACAPD